MIPSVRYSFVHINSTKKQITTHVYTIARKRTHSHERRNWTHAIYCVQRYFVKYFWFLQFISLKQVKIDTVNWSIQWMKSTSIVSLTHTLIQAWIFIMLLSVDYKKISLKFHCFQNPQRLALVSLFVCFCGSNKLMHIWFACCCYCYNYFWNAMRNWKQLNSKREE